MEQRFEHPEYDSIHSDLGCRKKQINCWFYRACKTPGNGNCKFRIAELEEGLVELNKKKWNQDIYKNDFAFYILSIDINIADTTGRIILNGFLSIFLI